MHQLYDNSMVRYIGANNYHNGRLEASTIYEKKLLPEDSELKELWGNYHCKKLTKYTAQTIRIMGKLLL